MQKWAFIISNGQISAKMGRYSQKWADIHKMGRYSQKWAGILKIW